MRIPDLRRLASLTVLTLVLGISSAWAGSPTVSNVRASQRAQTKLVDIFYDLSATNSGPLSVSVEVSTNNGTTYDLPASSFSGNGIGNAVTPGKRKKIELNAGNDLPWQYSSAVRFRVTAAESILNDGLVAYYPFNGNANDESGNGNNGTVYGATLTTNLWGAQNSAYYFNGTSSRIFVDDSTTLVLTNSLTLAAYMIALQPQNEHANQIIFRGDDRNALDPYSLFLIDGVTLFFGISDDKGNTVSLQAPISPAEWHQVVGTLDGTSGQMKLFIDSVVVASTNTAVRPLGLLTGPQPGLGLGHLQSASPLFKGCFKGTLDDIRIYNRALSSSEVMQLYTSGGGVTP